MEKECKAIEDVYRELQVLKQLTLLGAKKALTMNDASLLTGLSKSHIYKLVCAKKIPYYKSEGANSLTLKKSELEAWQLMHRVSTNAEIEAQAQMLSCKPTKRINN